MKKEYKNLIDNIQLNFRGLMISEKDKIVSFLEEFLSNCRKENIDWKVISESLMECGTAISNWICNKKNEENLEKVPKLSINKEYVFKEILDVSKVKLSKEDLERTKIEHPELLKREYAPKDESKTDSELG